MYQIIAVIFKIFDVDCDGKLNRSEVVQMLQCMLCLRENSLTEINDKDTSEVQSKADEILKTAQTQWLTIEDYLVKIQRFL